MPAPHLTLPEIETQIKQETDAKMVNRLRVIQYRLEEKGTGTIVRLLGFTEGWVRKLIHRYNGKGLAGLTDTRKNNGGNRSLLTEKEQKELLALFRKKHPDGGLWTGPKVARWIMERKKKRIREATGYDYLKRLGYTLQIPRPHHVKANKDKQAEFKKKSTGRRR